MTSKVLSIVKSSHILESQNLSFLSENLVQDCVLEQKYDFLPQVNIYTFFQMFVLCFFYDAIFIFDFVQNFDELCLACTMYYWLIDSHIFGTFQSKFNKIFPSL